MAKKKAALVVFCDYPPDRSEEFESWYMHTHLPDLKNTKGLVRARRFMGRNYPEQGPAQTMTLYEFETDDINESLTELMVTAGNASTVGRHIDVYPLVGMYSWEEIDPDSIKPLTKEQLSKYPNAPQE